MSVFTFPRILKVLMTAGTVSAYRQDIADFIKAASDRTKVAAINVWDVLNNVEGTRLTPDEWTDTMTAYILSELSNATTYSRTEVVFTLQEIIKGMKDDYCVWLKSNDDVPREEGQERK